MNNKEHIPRSADQPTVFKTNMAPNGTFDVNPFLEALSMFGSEGMAKNLDSIMQDLCCYYLEHKGAYNSSSAMIETVRLLRNALLKGGGSFTFPD